MPCWAQYDVTTGEICATNSVEVSNEELAKLGRAQKLLDMDANEVHQHMFDVADTKEHVLVQRPKVEYIICDKCQGLGHLGIKGEEEAVK